MRSRYKILSNDDIYFITSTTIEWIPVFTDEKYFNILLNVIKFHQSNNNLKIYCYLLLDNHFHMITSSKNLSKIISSIKSFAAKEVLKKLKIDNKDWLLNQLSYYKKKYKLKSKYQLWQEGFHPKLIKSEKVLKQKIEYIHYNPVKRGLVNLPEYWRYSSASDYYLEEKGELDIVRII